MRILIKVVTLLNFHFIALGQSEPTLDVIPNSFVDTTSIIFTLSVSDTVSLAVYNFYGELIDSLIKEQLILQGTQTVMFIGDTLPVGQYFVFLDVDTHLISKKFIKTGQMPIDIENNKFEKASLNIHPNPTTGKITITNLPRQASNITIYNIFGQAVF